MEYPELKCSTCGYVPDDEDIKRTDYHLDTCSCGQENVCDLCLSINAIYITDTEDGPVADPDKWECPACQKSGRRIGQDRKALFKELEQMANEEGIHDA